MNKPTQQEYNRAKAADLYGTKIFSHQLLINDFIAWVGQNDQFVRQATREKPKLLYLDLDIVRDPVINAQNG